MRKNFKNIDIFANTGNTTGCNTECKTFDTAEQIQVKQVYTAEDTAGM